MRKRLLPEIEAKYTGTNWLRTYNGPDGEFMIPNLIEVHQMPDEAHKDLVGKVRTRKRQAGDCHPPIPCPEKMQVWVTVDLEESLVIRWWYVDKRIQIVNENWFALHEVLLLPPSHWSPTMKNLYPGAVPSICVPTA